ncbi:hypothetical protein [Erwinia aphidicola]|uniref:hypothetical protein n=1 Tax=Erwinia aphidicola TaxID=68334 RepID=UPI00301A56AC
MVKNQTSFKSGGLMGKCVGLTVNGDLVQILNTDGAVAADYLSFIDGVVSTLQKSKEELETEANQSGRTLHGHTYSGVGSVSIPEVSDK